MDDFDLVETVMDSHIKDNNTCSDRLVNHISDNITINTTSKTKRNMPDSVKVDTSKHMKKLQINTYERFALLEIDKPNTIDDMRLILSLGYDSPIQIDIWKDGEKVGRVAIDEKVGVTERIIRAVALVCVSDSCMMALITYNTFLDRYFQLVGLKATESGYVQVMSKSIELDIGLDLNTLLPLCGVGHRFVIGKKRTVKKQNRYHCEYDSYDEFDDEERLDRYFKQSFEIYDCKRGTRILSYFFIKNGEMIECSGFRNNFVVFRFVHDKIMYLLNHNRGWLDDYYSVNQRIERLLFLNLNNGKKKLFKYKFTSKSSSIMVYEMPSSTVMILREDEKKMAWIITIDRYLNKIETKKFSTHSPVATLGIRPCLIGSISKASIFVIDAACAPKSYIPKSMTIAVTNGKEIEVRELSLSKRSYRQRPGGKKPFGFCFSEVERSVKCWLRSRYRNGGVMVEIRMLIGKGVYQISA